MSCGGTREHNANAACISDTVKDVNELMQEAGVGDNPAARVTTRDGREQFHRLIRDYKEENPRRADQDQSDYQQEAEAWARRRLNETLVDLSWERQKTAALIKHADEYPADAVISVDPAEERRRQMRQTGVPHMSDVNADAVTSAIDEANAGINAAYERAVAAGPRTPTPIPTANPISSRNLNNEVIGQQLDEANAGINAAYERAVAAGPRTPTPIPTAPPNTNPAEERRRQMRQTGVPHMSDVNADAVTSAIDEANAGINMARVHAVSAERREAAAALQKWEARDAKRRQQDAETIAFAAEMREKQGPDALLEKNVALPLVTAMVNQSLRDQGSDARINSHMISRTFDNEYDRVYRREMEEAPAHVKLMDKIPSTARSLEWEAEHTGGLWHTAASAGAAVLGGAPETPGERTPLEQYAHRTASAAAVRAAMAEGRRVASDDGVGNLRRQSRGEVA